MAGVPSPLQIGSPAAANNPFNDDVPAALRAGSPTVGPQGRPALTRKNTSGSDRLSQLFPSRPPSVVSITPLSTTAHSRRTSLPSPLAPAAEPSYRIPRAPAPPSFAEDTSYNPSPIQVDRSSSVQSSSGKRRLLNRLTSLSRGSSKSGRYNRLDDEESGTDRRRLRGVEEEDEAVGYDLSGLEGLPMKKFEPQTKMTSVVESRELERDMHEAGYAAEFERLESQLGAGMNTIYEKPFTYNGTPVAQLAHKRGHSGSEIVSAQAQEAQKEAEKTERIVAVADIPVDISDFTAGSDFDTRSIMTAETGLAKNEAETSYFFPQDPEQPSWRPFSMGKPWLAMLICIALILAGIQEFLCQISLTRVREDPEHGGLKKFDKPKDLSFIEFFTWKYAPIMTFVFYGILWQMTDFDVKRLEPYYQLSKKTGATAGESLNMDYLTFMSWLVPLRALRHKQYAVIYSSLGTLIASSLVPVLQSASTVVHPPKDQRTGSEEVLKSIRIDPRWSRAVTACLVFVAFSGAALMYAMQRKSGLQSDPKGIAGIAAMATKSHILTDFRGLDTAPLDKIHKQLRHRRYILHKSSLWQGEFIRNNREKIHEQGSDPRPLMLRKRAGVPFITFMILVTVSIPIFMFLDGAGIVTEKLPFLMTALATVIRIMWNTVNIDVRMLQPFWILAQRHAPAKTLTLDYTGVNPLLLPFQAGFNGHYLVMLVAFGSILAEILTVCVSSISVDGKKFISGHGGWDASDPDDIERHNTEQTFRSFWSSFVLSLGILIYLIAIGITTYIKRSHKFMPRQIGTMASVLAFIHQSRMLMHFIDTEKYDSSKMTKHLECKGKTFALGWIHGRDGDDHLGIDEEEVLSEYRYGKDWTKTRILGHQVGGWEHYE